MGTGIPAFQKFAWKPLHFYVRPTLVPVFANQKRSEEDFKLFVIAPLPYTISFYERFHKNKRSSSIVRKPVPFLRTERSTQFLLLRKKAKIMFSIWFAASCLALSLGTTPIISVSSHHSFELSVSICDLSQCVLCIH